MYTYSACMLIAPLVTVNMNYIKATNGTMVRCSYMASNLIDGLYPSAVLEAIMYKSVNAFNLPEIV